MMSSDKYVETELETGPKSKIYCSVYGCHSKKCKNPDLSFHYFPKPGGTTVEHIGKSGIIEMADRRQLWINALRFGKKISKNMRICSLHFKESDYQAEIRMQAGMNVKRKLLKSDSVPSRNLPIINTTLMNLTNQVIYNKIKSDKEIHDSLQNQVQLYHENVRKEEEERLRQEEEERLEREKEKAEEEKYCQCEILQNSHDESGFNSSNVMNGNGMNSLDLSGTNLGKKNYSDKGIQCTDLGNDKIGRLMSEEELLTHLHSKGVLYNFVDSIKTDEQMSTATGIHSLALLDKLVKCVELVLSNLKKRGTILSIRDRVIMTFVKLKQNVSYSFLCILFPSVTLRYCSDIICNMIDILEQILKPYVHFASLDEYSKNLPLCFAEYLNTQIILDCTEIRIQRPKNLCCQIATYSHYKGTNTVKFMTGVTPGGLISFVSQPYGGRASDKAIFEHTRLIEDIDKRGAVMVDKGFLIDDICLENNIQLLRPPFLSEREQFSEAEAIECSNIASARVHVERLNQRLKVFLILGSILHSNLLHKAEKIMIILSAIVNLSNPVFKDNKFHADQADLLFNVQ